MLRLLLVSPVQNIQEPESRAGADRYHARSAELPLAGDLQGLGKWIEQSPLDSVAQTKFYLRDNPEEKAPP